jgi:virC1 protein
MIISVVNEKGGSGKTTIAVNLAFKFAEQGIDTMLVDADPQRSVETLIDYRANNGLELPFTSVSRTGDSLAKEVRNLANKYDSIIIDTGGRDSKEMRQALLVSDIVLIPTIITSGFDQAVLNKMLNLISETLIMNENLKTLIVNNKASTNPMLQSKVQKFVDFLSEVELPQNVKLANIILHEREIYKNVIFDGKSVIELEDNKARDEVNALYKELLEFAKE